MARKGVYYCSGCKQYITGNYAAFLAHKMACSGNRPPKRMQ